MSEQNSDATSKKTPMTKIASSRIHSAEARKGGGKVKKGSFTSRAQRASAKNTSNN